MRGELAVTTQTRCVSRPAPKHAWSIARGLSHGHRSRGPFRVCLGRPLPRPLLDVVATSGIERLGAREWDPIGRPRYGGTAWRLRVAGEGREWGPCRQPAAWWRTSRGRLTPYRCEWDPASRPLLGAGGFTSMACAEEESPDCRRPACSEVMILSASWVGRTQADQPLGMFHVEHAHNPLHGRRFFHGSVVSPIGRSAAGHRIDGRGISDTLVTSGQAVGRTPSQLDGNDVAGRAAWRMRRGRESRSQLDRTRADARATPESRGLPCTTAALR